MNRSNLSEEGSSKSGVRTLSSMCQKVIAEMIERYPAESFVVLEEVHWDAIVRLKYQMTTPKVRVANGSSLSGGRKTPAISLKAMENIERANPHLRNSKVVDTLIWRDITDYIFKRNGPSRPAIMSVPWGILVKKMKSISEGLEDLIKQPNGNIEDDGKFISVQTNKLQTYVTQLIETPISIPLLQQSKIGKALKKFIKECKRNGSALPPYYPLINTVGNNTANPRFRGKSFLAQLETILSDWKVIAEKNGADSVMGRHRNTSKEQHLKDFETIQNCASWRDLYKSLYEREQITIKNRGANMRKIREDLDSERPKILSTKTKTGNRRLGERLLNDKPSPFARSTTSTLGKPSKLNMIKQQSMTQQARMHGSKPGKTSGFGSSVASSSSSGKKRSIRSVVGSSGINLTSKARQRTFALGDGKQMKLPSVKKRR